MKPRQKRLLLIVGGLVILGVAAALVLSAFRDNLVFFYTPSDVAAHKAPTGRPFRIGGLVRDGSLKRDGVKVGFVVTDTVSNIDVEYEGILPDLFRQGKGVVAQGSLDGSGVFHATEVLAKHDENYMPPEAGHALEQAKRAQSTLRP
ncbi:MAG TPA: cytochrome c maturation protein CcmE [Burkholderiaceae bacterium]|nr:cytochrome c maturation protein CcmE [Burkholderiaceae bacterium]